jgi:hypothetical protein
MPAIIFDFEPLSEELNKLEVERLERILKTCSHCSAKDGELHAPNCPVIQADSGDINDVYPPFYGLGCFAINKTDYSVAPFADILEWVHIKI